MVQESACPCGICRADWRLVAANAAMRDLLDAPGELVWALSRWLGQGSLENITDGKMLFRHGSGKSYLLTLQGAGGDAPDMSQVVICELPLSELAATAAQALRELDSILDFIHDGIWVIDGQGITRRINRAMERIAGIRAEEVVGRHVSEPLREGRFKTCVSLRALETRQTVTLFDDYANGTRCINTSTPIFDEHGAVWRVIAAIRDMTELETLKNRLTDLEFEAMAYRLRAEGLEEHARNGFLGQSPSMRRIRQDMAKAAQTDAITLILGETGCGKSMAAKIIHDMSARAAKPFVSINCGGIPSQLMESELFGYEAGAFTGAARGGKPGMLELAAQGTLLLDEIGELSLPMQAKLLHLLDGQPVYRIGGSRPIRMDARIIAATNRPLESMVAEGRFREDLFYRLRVLCVAIPPLRERRDDILLLAGHFLLKSGARKRLSQRAEQLFLAYQWPGNVRELQSVIQSLITFCERDLIGPEDLPPYMRLAAPAAPAPEAETGPRSLHEALESLEREMLAKALAETGSTYKAARRLGVSQSQVARKARKYGLHLTQQPLGRPYNITGRETGRNMGRE